MRCYVRCVRWATLVLLTLLAGCNDLRDFRGAWAGPRVGEATPLRVGAGDAANLAIDGIDAHGLTARLSIENLLPETSFSLYDDRRIEVRVLRGGTLPLYAIYALTES